MPSGQSCTGSATEIGWRAYYAPVSPLNSPPIGAFNAAIYRDIYWSTNV
jgi:hypothetical protein